MSGFFHLFSDLRSEQWEAKRPVLAIVKRRNMTDCRRQAVFISGLLCRYKADFELTKSRGRSWPRPCQNTSFKFVYKGLIFPIALQGVLPFNRGIRNTSRDRL